MLMNGSGEMLLFPSLRKWLTVALGSLIFVIIGIWMGLTANKPVSVFLIIVCGRTMGWICASFFGLALLAALLNLLLGASYLQMGEEGFVVSNLFRKHRYKWIEVQNFGVWIVPRPRTKMVGFDFTAFYQGTGTLRSTNQALCGFDASLPDTYGRSAEDLAALMNKRKAESSGKC
jgi:hypothetical protein